MAELTNSKRTSYQVTYSPIEVRHQPRLIRTWDRWSYFSSLVTTIQDFAALRRSLEQRARDANRRERDDLQQVLADASTLEELIPRMRTPDALSLVQMFQTISPASLIALGYEHFRMEEARAERVLNAHQAIQQAFAEEEAILDEPEVEAAGDVAPNN